MAKLKSALFGLNAKGTLGKALSFRRRGSLTIAEKKPIPTDANSPAQLLWRLKFQEAVALWHTLSPEEKQEWETQARPRHMTGFAWFISKTLKPDEVEPEPPEPALYEYCNTGDNGDEYILPPRWEAHTFTPLIAHTITSVKLKMWRYNLPGIITVSIRATDAEGHPFGEDLCSGQIDCDEITDESPGLWYEISLGDGINLSAGTKYAIVARAPEGDSYNGAYLRRNSNNPYPRGCRERSNDTGETWTTIAAHDFMFEDWGVP